MLNYLFTPQVIIEILLCAWWDSACWTHKGGVEEFTDEWCF